MNLSLRKNNSSNKIYCIDSFDTYNVTLEESMKHYKEIRKIAFNKNPLKFWMIYWKVSLMNVSKISDLEKNSKN